MLALAWAIVSTLCLTTFDRVKFHVNSEPPLRSEGNRGLRNDEKASRRYMPTDEAVTSLHEHPWANRDKPRAKNPNCSSEGRTRTDWLEGIKATLARGKLEFRSVYFQVWDYEPKWNSHALKHKWFIYGPSPSVRWNKGKTSFNLCSLKRKGCLKFLIAFKRNLPPHRGEGGRLRCFISQDPQK